MEDQNGDPREEAGRTLFERALELAEQDEHEAALRAVLEVVERFGEGVEPWGPRLVAAAQVTAGSLLAGAGRHEEAVAAFDDAVVRADGREDEPTRSTLARALDGRASSLVALDRQEEAVASSRALAARFAGHPDPAVRRRIAWSVHATASAPGVPADLAIAAWSEIERRFGGEREPRLREAVTVAMGHLARALVARGRHEEALAVLDRLLARLPAIPGGGGGSRSRRAGSPGRRAGR